MSQFKDLRIIFLGTPEFAVASLQALVEAGANVVAVITAPDKPAGRGKKLQQSAVKEYAVSQDLKVLQPERLKNPEFLEELKSYNADLQVVVAFRMLPEAVWDMPPMGTINVHGSLLPQYRGAAPINRAIMNGETESGVTTFKLKHEIDTGDILLQKKVQILPEDNVGTLYEKLMAEGAKLIVETVEGLAEGKLTEVPQASIAEEDLKAAPKIFKEDTRIDWSRSVVEIHNHIRGLSPYPGALTELQGKVFKIYKSRYEQGETHKPYGEYETDGKTYLRFAAKDGWVYAEDIQQQGKKRMDIASFLRGFRD